MSKFSPVEGKLVSFDKKLTFNYRKSITVRDLCLLLTKKAARSSPSTVSDNIYLMFIVPMIAWVSSGFSAYIWLDTKIVFKKVTAINIT